MAIAATIEWEVRTTGTASNANGGGYKPGSSGTDFSQQDAAQYNLTLVTTAAADAILLSASAAADMVGNLAHIVSGTNFTAGWYEIISVSVGVSITLDRTCTTAAGAAGVVNIGGALSLGSADDAVFESMEPGNIMYIKSGTYTIGGAVSVAKTGTSGLPIRLVGYDTSRSVVPAEGSRPTLAFAALTARFADYNLFESIIFTTTETDGIAMASGCLLSNRKITNSSGTASRVACNGVSNASDGLKIINSELISTNGTAIANSTTNDRWHIDGCYIHDSVTGISATAIGTVVTGCIIDTCTTGISVGATALVIVGCTLYSGTTGISIGTQVQVSVLHNIISGFTTGISATSNIAGNLYDYNNFHNNTTNRSNVTAGDNDIALDPQFTDAPNGNFTPGTNMKITVPFPGGLTTTYAYLGAVQPNATGGSSGGARVMGAGIVSGG